MERIRRWIAPPAAPTAYAPIEDDEDNGASSQSRRRPSSRFSRFEYAVFFLLGISMLWAWNMFLAAAPYFYRRFHSDDWAATHYQPFILAVSTITNLGSSFILAKLQKGASHQRRIILSLLINIVVFTLLAFSTVLLEGISVRAYFAFLMIMVFGASLATGINQIGVFAYVSGFGREEYTQAIMGGQGVAGVLPCIVQILSVLAVPEQKAEQDLPQQSSKSAFVYFITSTGVSTLALLAFISLAKRRSTVQYDPLVDPDDSSSDQPNDKAVGLWTLFTKLRLPAVAIFLCFTITMIYPVFTAEIESVRADSDRSRLFQQAVFVPLAFLFWNAGDLAGRMLVLVPGLSLAHRPFALIILAVARLGFIPLYLLCNIRGRGAAIHSDFFYLFIVQLFFGITNGYLGSSCMMGAGHWVTEDEREPAGGFMSLMLVGGLAMGSLLSFLVAGA
ncbi:nucleoside transporter-domain-containing protein [Aspergillus ambiguus]|uniref:nucleoside transmembrane transporter FUN26 n=1 Tax=Aspergillus ambiguus TaxID=176160 RepID=UPI003CCCB847